MPPLPLCSTCTRRFSSLFPAPVLPTHRSNPSLRPPTPQLRHASILSSLSDIPSAYHKRIRLGRGPSSGKGKTSGRGHKGQKQHGKVPRGFEGGQTPLSIVHGKRGFKNVFSPNLTTLPLPRIQSWIAQNRLSASAPITVRELVRSNCISLRRASTGVKLLASSHSHQASLDAQPPLTYPLHIVVSRASAAAIAAVEKAGGSVTTRYYTPFALRQIVAGRMDPVMSLRSELAATAKDTDRATDTATPPPPAIDFNQENPAPAAASPTPTPTFTPTPTPEPIPAPAPQPQYPFRLPDAISRKAIEYYRDPAHRGYLAHTVAEGQGPSLYFRPPVEMSAAKRAAVARVRRRLEENRLW